MKLSAILEGRCRDYKLNQCYQEDLEKYFFFLYIGTWNFFGYSLLKMPLHCGGTLEYNMMAMHCLLTCIENCFLQPTLDNGFRANKRHSLLIIAFSYSSMSCVLEIPVETHVTAVLTDRHVLCTLLNNIKT